MLRSSEEKKLTRDNYEVFCEMLSIASVDNENPASKTAKMAIKLTLEFLFDSLTKNRIKILCDSLDNLSKQKCFLEYSHLFSLIIEDIKSGGKQLDSIKKEYEEEGGNFSEQRLRTHTERVNSVTQQPDLLQMRFSTGMSEDEFIITRSQQAISRKSSPISPMLLANIYCNDKKFLEAIDQWLLVIAALNAISDSKAAENDNTIAICHACISKTYYYLKSYQKARDEALLAITGFGKISSEARTTKDRELLADCHEILALLYLNNKEHAQAWEQGQLAIAELNKIPPETRSAKNHNALALYHGKIAMAHFEHKEYTLACEEWRLTITELYKIPPEAITEKNHSVLAFYHGNIAAAHNARKEYALACEELQLAIEALKKIPADFIIEADRRNLAAYHDSLAQCLYVLEKYLEARAEWQLAIAELNKLPDENITANDHAVLARNHGWIANTHAKFGEVQQASAAKRLALSQSAPNMTESKTADPTFSPTSNYATTVSQVVQRRYTNEEKRNIIDQLEQITGKKDWIVNTKNGLTILLAINNQKEGNELIELLRKYSSALQAKVMKKSAGKEFVLQISSINPDILDQIHLLQSAQAKSNHRNI